MSEDRESVRRAAALIAAVVGAWAVAEGAVFGFRVFRRAVGIALGTVRVCYVAATLQLLRRCPDCRRLIVRDARVCRHCGWRRRRAGAQSPPEAPTGAPIPSHTSPIMPST
jgi:hypothetical protein